MANPFSFRPGQVTFWTTLVYLALLIPIIIINEAPPPSPRNTESPLPGINLTQAWLDLTTITRAYHPYNSHYNEVVRGYLLKRVREILEGNGVAWNIDGAQSSDSNPAVTVFDDTTSNCTFLMESSVVPGTHAPQVAAYFEGTNILVYVRGKLDDKGSWWKTAGPRNFGHVEKGLTLVNAHYDSVSTGYGATDDGMGVVTCLQLIQYFTTPDHQPDRGIVILLNNGEEDWLYGARAFGQHPLLPYIHTFLNLEGAGAGGRANLFRTTDREVTAAYAGSPHPFGTVIASDAFGLGFIRSGTDYSVLYNVYGQRGLDLAFFKPRARYHTNQDDARHASLGSLWHMLSAAVHTTSRLSSNAMGNRFVGPRPDGARNKVRNGRPSDGVWFDLFGKGFVLFGLRGMFAWSLTLLVTTPLILMFISYVLHRVDKYYLFSSRADDVRGHAADDDGHGLGDEPVFLGGWKGFFRFPFAMLVSGSLTLGSALLMKKVNPFIVYGNQYTVWAMMVSLFYFSFWAIMRGANFARPSALHRTYVQVWLFVIGWAILVAVTVSEDRLKIAAGYVFVFLQSSLFLTLFIALCEMFALPKKAIWAAHIREARQNQQAHDFLQGQTSIGEHSPLPTVLRQEQGLSPRGSNHPASPHTNNRDNTDDDVEAELPTERTPLVGGNIGGVEQVPTTFATTYRRSISSLVKKARQKYSTQGYEAFEYEQPWSAHLPTWTWLLQFLLLGPFTIVLVAQTGLMLVDAVHQTGADGSNLLLPYLIIFLFTVLLILPLTPFIHRVTHHIPVFLLVVFGSTLVYNLAAFPFSASARYKAYFIQTLTLDNQTNTICYNGIEKPVRKIISTLPSSLGKEVACSPSKREGLVACCYEGSGLPLPKLTQSHASYNKTEWDSYRDLVNINATRLPSLAPDLWRARLEISASNTKACFVEFATPISALKVHGSSAWDDRFGVLPESGIKTLKLWHREWNKTWVVDVEWNGQLEENDGNIFDGQSGGKRRKMMGNGELKTRNRHSNGLHGTVACMWSDANEPSSIPALEEALQYAPVWATVSKLSEGLVEGRKVFSV